jgi:hypothetical protein
MTKDNNIKEPVIVFIIIMTALTVVTILRFT